MRGPAPAALTLELALGAARRGGTAGSARAALRLRQGGNL